MNKNGRNSCIGKLRYILIRYFLSKIKSTKANLVSNIVTQTQCWKKTSKTVNGIRVHKIQVIHHRMEIYRDIKPNFFPDNERIGKQVP